MTTDRPRRDLLAAIVLAMVISAPALGSVPMWDGWVYAKCVLDAVYGESLRTLACAKHPTQGYLGVLYLTQWLDRGSAALLHLTNLGFHAAALWGVQQTLRRLIPRPEHRTLRLLGLLGAAVQPVVLGSLFHTNPDVGVYAYAMVVLGALCSRRWLIVYLATFGLAFSKETGIAVALVLAIAAPLLDPRWRSWRIARASWVPILVAVGWVAWPIITGGRRVWAGTGEGANFRGFAPFGWDDPTFHGYLFGIFALNFRWILTAITIVGAVVLWRRRRSEPTTSLREWAQQPLIVVSAVTVVTTLGLTSYHTFQNLRYLLVLYPLWLIVALAVVSRSVTHPARSQALGATILLSQLVAVWGSWDPISRLYHGSFDAGGRSFYELTARTGECCGFGQDQLVYNLEYTNFSKAQDALFAQLPIGDSVIFVSPKSVSWHPFAALDSATHRRTLHRDESYLPDYHEETRLLRKVAKIERFWFIIPPNADSRAERAAVERYYAPVEEITGSHGGVRYRATAFVRR